MDIAPSFARSSTSGSHSALGRGRLFVDLEASLVREDDSVGCARELDRREVVEDILAYLLRRTVERVAVAGRVGRLDPDHLAGGARDPGHLRGKLLLSG